MCICCKHTSSVWFMCWISTVFDIIHNTWLGVCVCVYVARQRVGAFVWICAIAIVMCSNHFSVFPFLYLFDLLLLSKSIILTRNGVEQSRAEYRTVHQFDNMINAVDVRECSLRLQQSAKMNKRTQNAHKQFGHLIKLARRHCCCEFTHHK